MNTGLTLYKQISRKLENDILAGKLPPGYRIPSVRELAAQYQVNPNTVQRAVRELKQTGLLVSLRGRGTLVTDDADYIYGFKQKRGKELVCWFIREMELLGYSNKQAKTMVMTKIYDDGQTRKGKDTMT